MAQHTGIRTPRRREWSLATQFAVAGGLVMALAMVAVGLWVTGRIEAGVVRNTANATALYMESFISPISQDLAVSSTLSPGARRAMDEIFSNTPLGQRVASYKIWKPDGLVVDASNPAIIGGRFEVTENLRLALQGEVRAEFNELGDPENVDERALGVPLLEIYSPIREVWSGRVIGVAEFYEIATGLKQDLGVARRNSWAAVALVMALIGASLYAIVLRGSRTIDRQVRDLTQLSEHNTALRLRMRQAVSRFTEMNDQTLRRIGADLHDGPAQLMALAALHVDTLRAAAPSPKAQAEIDAMDCAIRDAMAEIRAISRGLSLPDIARRSLDRIVRDITGVHAARTGTAVEVTVSLPEEPPDLPPAVKICVHRFVQEGLTNAWRHGGGQGQRVRLALNGSILRVTVLDRGPGLPPDGGAGAGMGLAGLRDRVESLGGVFELTNRPEVPRGSGTGPGGTRLRMTLDVKGDA